MKKFIIILILSLVILPTFASHLSPINFERILIESSIEVISDREILEQFYKEKIPKTYYNAFIHYTRNMDDDFRREFYSIMVIESGYFKNYINKNQNNSYDYGPSQLNSNNIKNKNFMKKFAVNRHGDYINSLYTWYMVITINYYKALKDDLKDINKALYAYNGGYRAIKAVEAKRPSKKQKRLKDKVRNYRKWVVKTIKSTKNKQNQYIKQYRTNWLKNNQLVTICNIKNNLNIYLFNKIFVENKISYRNLYKRMKFIKNFFKYWKKRTYFFDFIKEEIVIVHHPTIFGFDEESGQFYISLRFK